MQLPADLRHALRRTARPLAAVLTALTVSLTVVGLVLFRIADSWPPATWDLSVDRWIARNRVGPLDALARGSTWLAETVPVLVLTVVAVAVVARLTRRWEGPLLVALAVGGEKLVYLIVSLLVRRDRPPVPTLGTTYATSSFPSGHVGSAVALYGGVAVVLVALRMRRVGTAAVAFAVVATALVAFSRLYRGFHHPSDVVAGCLLGVAWLAALRRHLRP